MSEYCINKNPGERYEHEVHNLDANCGHLPNPSNRDPLGQHASCHGAVKAARDKRYSTADGCEYCSPDCHTK